MKRILRPSVVVVLAAAALPDGTVAHGSAAAAETQFGVWGHGGTTAMLRLRLPFGEEWQSAPAATLTLGISSPWAVPTGQYGSDANIGLPIAEAGLTFGGRPVLHVGSMDVFRFHPNRRASSDGTDAADGSRNGAWLWIVGGLAAVAVLTAVSANNKNGTSDNTSCDLRYYTYSPKSGVCVLDPNKPGAFR